MTSQTSERLKYGSWGVVLGAVVAMVIGFTWGGWVTESTADEMSEDALAAARSAICVAQFMNAPDHEAQLQAFQDTESWKRNKFVEEGGWDNMPGESEADRSVARACAEGIAVLTVE